MTKRWIAVVVVLAGWGAVGCMAHRPPAPSSASRLEFRLVAPRKTGSTQSFPLAGRDASLACEREVLFTIADVDSAWSERDPDAADRYDVTVRFRPDAAKRFDALIQHQTGRRLGIIVDGVLTGAPVLIDGATATRIPVMFGLEAARADTLAMEFQASATR